MTPDVLVSGEALIDFLPVQSGSLSNVEQFQRQAGGAPANVAVGLATFGHSPLFWTRLGDDTFGRYLEDTIVGHGVSGRFIECDTEGATPIAFVSHDDERESSFTFYRERSADTRLRPGRISDETLELVDWVHAGGVSLSAGRSREATLELLERASCSDCTVSFDPNVRTELWPDQEIMTQIVRRALADVDVLKATVTELEKLGFHGDTPQAVATACVNTEFTSGSGPHTVFVTRGSDGAVAVTSDRSPWTGDWQHDGFDVEARDTTGAGDAFVAGMISSLLSGNDFRETLTYASAAGALSTTAAGGMEAIPDRDSVVTALQTNFDGQSQRIR